MTAAIAFAMLSVIAVVIVPLAPGIEASGSEVVDHFEGHAGMVRVRALLAAVALLALVVVLANARERLDGPAGHVFTVGAAVLVAQVGVQLWLTAGLALHASNLDPVLARTFNDVMSMWGPVLTVAGLLLAGPVIWACRRGRFPYWLAIIAAAFAVEKCVEVLTIIGPAGSFIAPGGPMTVFLGGALFLVFLFALGVAAALPGDSEVVADPSDESSSVKAGRPSVEQRATESDTLPLLSDSPDRDPRAHRGEPS